jgi:hypothetical protein
VRSFYLRALIIRDIRFWNRPRRREPAGRRGRRMPGSDPMTRKTTGTPVFRSFPPSRPPPRPDNRRQTARYPRINRLSRPKLRRPGGRIHLETGNESELWAEFRASFGIWSRSSNQKTRSCDRGENRLR